MISEWMDDDDGIFACLHYFIQIADCSVADGGCERSIVPNRLFSFEEKSTDEIGRRQIFVASNRD